MDISSASRDAASLALRYPVADDVCIDSMLLHEESSTADSNVFDSERQATACRASVLANGAALEVEVDDGKE